MPKRRTRDITIALPPTQETSAPPAPPAHLTLPPIAPLPPLAPPPPLEVLENQLQLVNGIMQVVHTIHQSAHQRTHASQIEVLMQRKLAEVTTKETTTIHAPPAMVRREQVGVNPNPAE